MAKNVEKEYILQTEEEIRDKLAGLVVKEGESRGDKALCKLRERFR